MFRSGRQGELTSFVQSYDEDTRLERVRWWRCIGFRGSCSLSAMYIRREMYCVPIPFGSSAIEVADDASGLVDFVDSFTMVDVEEERLKVLASGAR